MSAYSDWKYGLITDDQYRSACMREAAEDEADWWDKMSEEEEDGTATVDD